MQGENLETSQNHQVLDCSALNHVDAASILLSHVRANCQEDRYCSAKYACETGIIIETFGVTGWGLSHLLGWNLPSSPLQKCPNSNDNKDENV
jgi:hypothetical protein